MVVLRIAVYMYTAAGIIEASSGRDVIQYTQTGTVLQVLGNHEFDYGNAKLASYIRNVSTATPVLGACNIDTSQEPDLRGLLKKYAVLRYNAGNKSYKVGETIVVATPAKKL